MARYKYRGDVALGHLFQQQLISTIQAHFAGYQLTVVPLDANRLKERGFNQVEELLKGISWHCCLGRSLSSDNKKQSKKTRVERIKWFNYNPFYVLKQEIPLIKGKNYLILDDIYTTGVTVRLIAKILKENGAKKVASLTVARAIKKIGEPDERTI